MWPRSPRPSFICMYKKGNDSLGAIALQRTSFEVSQPMRYGAVGFIDQSALSLSHTNTKNFSTYSVTPECVTSQSRQIGLRGRTSRRSSIYVEALSWPDRDQAWTKKLARSLTCLMCMFIERGLPSVVFFRDVIACVTTGYGKSLMIIKASTAHFEVG